MLHSFLPSWVLLLTQLGRAGCREPPTTPERGHSSGVCPLIPKHMMCEALLMKDTGSQCVLCSNPTALKRCFLW